MTGMVAGYHNTHTHTHTHTHMRAKEKKGGGGGGEEEKRRRSDYLKNNPVFDWQPVKCLGQWSNMFMSALAKNNLRCMVLNFLQPVHLITVDVGEQNCSSPTD